MLLSLVARRCQRGGARCRSHLWARRRLTTSIPPQDEPLRILFCGTEAFSITALEALREYQDSGTSNILSIDVATKMDKMGGRGMKELRSPQIKRAAAQLGLRVHQFDTFTGWHLPEYPNTPHPYINLIIAVSFGLLVPPRILNNAKFGGINVHPSMLPDLRGAAPVNWTILNGYTKTGVTLQTLHPSKFDHGAILSQTPQPGITIPEPNKITAHELRLLLAPIGAEMLVDAIRNKLYLNPHTTTWVDQQFNIQPRQSSQPPLPAPKIVPSMKILNPYEDSLRTILRKNRAIPRLWAEATSVTAQGDKIIRVIFGPSLRAAVENELPLKETKDIIDNIPFGVPFVFLPPSEDIHQSRSPLFIRVRGGSILAIPQLLVAGRSESPAAAAAAHAKLFREPCSAGPHSFYQFHRPLRATNQETQGV